MFYARFMHSSHGTCKLTTCASLFEGDEDLNDLTHYLLHQKDRSEKEDPNAKGLLTNSHILMILFDIFGGKYFPYRSMQNL